MTKHISQKALQFALIGIVLSFFFVESNETW